MPQRRTAIKDLRKNEARRLHNMDFKTDLKKTIKSFLIAVNAKNVADGQNLLKTVYKKLDKASKFHILSRNTAARRKSRFSRLLTTIKKP